MPQQFYRYKNDKGNVSFYDSNGNLVPVSQVPDPNNRDLHPNIDEDQLKKFQESSEYKETELQYYFNPKGEKYYIQNDPAVDPNTFRTYDKNGVFQGTLTKEQVDYTIQNDGTTPIQEGAVPKDVQKNYEDPKLAQKKRLEEAKKAEEQQKTGEVKGTSTTDDLGLAPNQRAEYDKLVKSGFDTSNALKVARDIPVTESTAPGEMIDPSQPPPGVTQEEWAKLDPGTQAALSAINQTLQNQLEQNQEIPVALTDKDLDDLFRKAQNDPVISKFYGDRLRMGTDAFTQDLKYLQGSLDQQGTDRALQFAEDRQALADLQAEKGTAYSGFRGQAQEKLSQQQAGIIESSRRDIQKSLDDATKAFEEKYGSAATNPASITLADPNAASQYTIGGLLKPGVKTTDMLRGATLGNIAGSEATAKLGDIEEKYQSSIENSLLKSGATT